MIVRLQFPGFMPYHEEEEIDLAALPRVGEVVDFDEDWAEEALAGESFEVKRVIHPANPLTYIGRTLASGSPLAPAPTPPICILIR